MPGLSFLNAALLWFAALSILPLLIWLFAKKRPPRLLFSSLKFIKLSSEQEKSRSRITNIILLIIRILIILLVALAVARPVFYSAKGKGSVQHPPTAIAIILDTSYSMDYVEDGVSLLQRAANAVRSINARATQQDRLILISRDAAFNAVHSQIFAGEIPSDILERLSFGWDCLPWEELISLAESKLAEAQMANNEIYIFTDLLNEELRLKSSHPISILHLDTKDARQNLSVSEARPLPQMVGRNRVQSLEFRLSNHSHLPQSEVLVQLVVNDIKLAEKFYSLAPRASSLEKIDFEIKDEGWQAGYIEVLDERLLPDNRAYFAFEYYQNPKVAVITESALPHTLKSALKLYSGGKEPDLIPPSQLNLQATKAYKLLVFYDLPALSPRLRELISVLDESGQGSLFCLSPRLTQEMESFLEQRFETQLNGYKNSSIQIDYISPHHASTALISGKQRKYSQITGYWEASGGQALIASGSHPLALTHKSSALWLWNLAQDSSFFIDPAFAVYAYLQASLLQSAQAPAQELLVGDYLFASQLILPTSELISLPLPRYYLTQPGIYQVNPNTPQAYSLAVNHLYVDSEATPGKIEGKYKLFSADFEDEIFSARLGRDIWKYLLMMALILVVLEIAIVKRQEIKSRTGG